LNFFSICIFYISRIT